MWISWLQRLWFHPYQLFFRAEDKENRAFLKKYARGRIVDIGCGSAIYRGFCLALPEVESYLPVDYPGWVWGGNFRISEQLAARGGRIGASILRSSPIQAQVWADGTNLGLKSEVFDTVISIGVLEHVRNYEDYISEAARVLKKKGRLLVCVPFLYQAHGGEDAEDDFFRWTHHGIRHVLEKHALRCIDIESYGGVGVMFSQLVNSYPIKKLNIYGKNMSFAKLVLFGILLAPFFLSVNLLSRIIELLDRDKNYASGFRVMAEKP